MKDLKENFYKLLAYLIGVGILLYFTAVILAPVILVVWLLTR